MTFAHSLTILDTAPPVAPTAVTLDIDGADDQPQQSALPAATASEMPQAPPPPYGSQSDSDESTSCDGNQSAGSMADIVMT